MERRKNRRIKDEMKKGDGYRLKIHWGLNRSLETVYLMVVGGENKRFI